MAGSIELWRAWSRRMRGAGRCRIKRDPLSIPPKNRSEASDELRHLATISTRAGLLNVAQRLRVIADWLESMEPEPVGVDPETKGEITK
jgi:hypothetical protein